VAVSDASEQVTTDHSTAKMTTIDAFVSNNCTCLGSGLYFVLYINIMIIK